MGRIRKNVNWTAKITEGYTGETGFSIVGRKNPILVHVGETDIARDATVMFKQCEFDSRGVYEFDKCVINQRPPLTFSLKYYDYNEDTSYFSSGATVEFTSTNGESLGTGFVESDGSCSFKYKDDSLTEILAKIVVRPVKFNATHTLHVDRLSAYQTSINVIREAKNNINYSSGIPASAETSYDYDNGTEISITAGTTSEIHMLHKTESGGNIQVKDNGFGNITFTGEEIHFSRNAVNETNADFKDAEVVFYCGEKEETVKFLAPKKAKINYSTTYKCVDYSSFDLSGVTSTTYNEDAFTKNLYDPNVFGYMTLMRPSLKEGEVRLDIDASDPDTFESGTVKSSINITIPEDSSGRPLSIYGSGAWSKTNSVNLQVMSNKESILNKMTSKLYVGAEERLTHNEKMPYYTTKGGSTQFRFANENNALWASDVQNQMIINNRNHPGFLRPTENPAMNLRIATIKYASGETPSIIESGITHVSKWDYMYMDSGGNTDAEPTVAINEDADIFSTWVVFDKEQKDYSLAHIKMIGTLRFTQNSLKTNETTAANFRNALVAALENVTIDQEIEKVTYPQFGTISHRNQKYISFFSPSNRYVAIINRSADAQSGETLESSIYNDRLVNSYVQNLVNLSLDVPITQLSALTSVELFKISNQEVSYTENWGLSEEQAEYDINNHGDESIASSGYQWSVVMNMARTMVSASTVMDRDDIFYSGATSIYGFLYRFDVSDSDSACTKVRLSKNASGVYTASTDFYNRSEGNHLWTLKKGADVPRLDDFLSASTSTSDFVNITPILLSSDNTEAAPSGLTAVINRGNYFRATYTLSGERGLLRYDSYETRYGLDDVQTWFGIKLALDKNDGAVRGVNIQTKQKDKYHYAKNSLTRIRQMKENGGIAPNLWENDTEPGNKSRNEAYFELIQLGSGGTNDLYEFMDSKIKSYDYSQNYEKIKSYGGSIRAVFAKTDNKIKVDNNPSVRNNPYNKGPWIFDFVNYASSPYDESLCIELVGGQNATVTAKGFSGGTLRYSTDGNSYYNFPNSSVTLSDKIFMRGNFSGASSTIGTIVISGTDSQVKVSKNIMSLVYSSDAKGRYSLKNVSKDYMFNGLFSGNTCITDASELYLLGDTKKGCFKYMFAGCTGLKVAPRLLAWNLETDCYYGMFSGCTSLTDIYCMAKTISASSSGATTGWLSGVPEGLTFVRNNQSDNNFINGLGVPSNTNIITLEDGRT